MHTALLRHQHHEIASIVNEMRKHLLAPQRMTRATADGLHTSMETLSGRISAHLMIEDRGLYPKLEAATIPSAGPTGARFAMEMIPIANNWAAFKAKWSSGEKIHADAKIFVDECATFFHVLSHRIDAEEKELYPLADALP
jgi:hemerythrin-like domain-containing protein